MSTSISDTPSHPQRTSWFRDAGWGVFFHYLASPASSRGESEMTSDEWNRRIDGFDVEGLGEQLEHVGAGYLFITIGQGSGFYLAPNDVYDSMVPRDQSRLSRRDLIADLGEELSKRGVRLLVYLPSRAPYSDDYAIDRLGFRTLFDASATRSDPKSYSFPPNTDTQFPEAQRNWEAVIREWSVRWGELVIDSDGVFTWDIPPTEDGHIRDDFIPTLEALGDATR